MRYRVSLVLAALLAVAAVSCRPTPEPEPPPEGTPKLVVFLVMDQFRYDYLERGRELYTGGLKRLLDRGVSFTDAHHGHAVTLTGPGHASLSTGVHPARSGIVGNSWFDRSRNEWVYCVEDERHGTSPANLRVSTLGDWMKERYPGAKVVAASGKDRGAVLTGGHAADIAIWFDDDAGGFESSDYYPQDREWLQDFNDALPPVDLFTAPWEPLPVDPEAAAAAGFGPFDRGPFDDGFPRLVGGYDAAMNRGFWWSFYRTPIVDTWLGELGRELVERYDLGGDQSPDFLGLGFSALDTVGHPYGPHSLEVLDTLLRLDRTLGELFAYLDARVGEGEYLVAFSSDHGVVDLPEVVGPPARRAGIPETLCVRRVVQALTSRYGPELWLTEGFYFDDEVLAAAGTDRASVQAELDELASACPGVEDLRTLSELAASPAPVGPYEPGTATWYELLYRNSVHPDLSPDALVQHEESFLPVAGSITTHGSPYAYDTHVPFIVLAPGLPGQIAEPVLTVDLAPTLAALLAVPVPDDLDGRDLTPLATTAQPRPPTPVQPPEQP